MEMVELELDQKMRLEECEMECQVLRDELKKQEMVANEYQTIQDARVNQLKEEIEAVSGYPALCAHAHNIVCLYL